MDDKSDKGFMLYALELAKKAYELDEVPVGALVVKDGEIISEGWNVRENTFDPTAHAEVIAIKSAADKLRNWRLQDAILYVTKEPCIMCCGAIINARIKKVVYGCNDEKGGGAQSLYSLLNDPRINHRAEVVSGVCEAECTELLKRFFREKRV
jgi:tRNA(adenine34) deaminase